jgi:hypothetical protein
MVPNPGPLARGFLLKGVEIVHKNGANPAFSLLSRSLRGKRDARRQRNPAFPDRRKLKENSP